MPSYRHNETDKAIDQIEEAAADSTIVVNTISGGQKNVGTPTGAGIDVYPRKNGVVASFGDKPERLNAKAGKARTSDTGQ